MPPSSTLRSRIEAFEFQDPVAQKSGSNIGVWNEKSVSVGIRHGIQLPGIAGAKVVPQTAAKAFKVPQNDDNGRALSLDSPNSPTAQSLAFIRPIIPVQTPPRSRSRSPSPAILGRKSSLIDMSEVSSLASSSSLNSRSIAPTPPLPPRPSSSSHSSAKSVPYPSPTSREGSLFDQSDLSLMSFNSPPSPAASSWDDNFSLPSPESARPRTAAPPPLPPRKPSIQSFKSTSTSNATSTTRDRSGPSSPMGSSWQITNASASASSLLHVYTPELALPQSRHAHSSSLQSVSLSSDGGDPESHRPTTEETVTPAPSVSQLVGAMNHRANNSQESVASSQQQKVPYAPRLPPRPRNSAQALPSPVTPTGPTRPTFSPPKSLSVASRKPAPPPPQPSYSIRRVAPPPVPIDLSNSQSKSLSAGPTITIAGVNGTTDLSVTRTPPIPPNARRRYDILFEKNVASQANKEFFQPKTSYKSHGWRGLDIDDTLRLDGRIVKVIWRCSRLDHNVLRNIWIECDPAHHGSLDRDAFAAGMWKVDEHLAKAASGRPFPSRSLSARSY